MSREVEILQGVTSSSRRTLHRRSRAAHATNQLGTFSLTMTLKQPLAALSQQASQRRMLGETVRTPFTSRAGPNPNQWGHLNGYSGHIYGSSPGTSDTTL